MRLLYSLTLLYLAPLPKFCSVPEIPNFAYLISAAYFFATGGGYDKLEVYKCSDGVKAPAVTREMVIRFPSCMVSWRHKEFHMVIQMLHLNLLPISTPELSTSTELVTRLLSIWGTRQQKSYVLHGKKAGRGCEWRRSEWKKQHLTLSFTFLAWSLHDLYMYVTNDLQFKCLWSKMVNLKQIMNNKVVWKYQTRQKWNSPFVIHWVSLFSIITKIVLLHLLSYKN